MKKNKHSDDRPEHGGYEHLSSNSDLYAGSPMEQPLYDDRRVPDRNHAKATARHQTSPGRRDEGVDIREKMALLAILKAVIMIVFLLLAFFLLMKGVQLYEEKAILDNVTEPEISPVLKDVPPLEDFDVSARPGAEAFSKRIEAWKEAERLVGSASALLQGDNFDGAMERCQEALEVDPWHTGALECLGRLYYEQDMLVEAINAYIRALSVEPSREDLQLALIKSLDAAGDSEATISMAKWYQEVNIYNQDVQQAIANAYFMLERDEDAAAAYERLLKDVPGNAEALDNVAITYMRLKKYEAALPVLERLSRIRHDDPSCYKRAAICHAQLGDGSAAVQTLGQAAYLFGISPVHEWIQDPQMDAIRQDRTFQAFVSKVGGEEFRRYLEELALRKEMEGAQAIQPHLSTTTKDQALMELLGEE